MSERHWPRPALATTALALLGATAVAGCGGGSASSDLPAYWNWHITREHDRNHLSKLRNPPAPQHTLELAA